MTKTANKTFDPKADGVWAAKYKNGTAADLNPYRKRTSAALAWYDGFTSVRAFDSK